MSENNGSNSFTFLSNESSTAFRCFKGMSKNLDENAIPKSPESKEKILKSLKCLCEVLYMYECEPTEEVLVRKALAHLMVDEAYRQSDLVIERDY